jgi:subtilase family serine protease
MSVFTRRGAAAFTRRGAVAAGAAAALTVTVTGLAAAPPALAAAPRHTIGGTRPGWAVTANLADRAVASGSLRARVYLAGRDPAGLAAYATAVSTPGNALYRHFLTLGQARARFGVAPAELRAVRSWLSGAGLRVTAVNDPGPAGAYLAVRGSLAAAGRAFAVTFARYRGPGGRLYRAPAEPASVPAPVAGAVLSVTGLDTAPHVATPDLAGTDPAPGGTGSGASEPAPGSGGAGPGARQAAPGSGGAGNGGAGSGGAGNGGAGSGGAGNGGAGSGGAGSGGAGSGGAGPGATATASRSAHCSSYWGQNTPQWIPRAYRRHWPTSICGYYPRQLRGAYGVTSSGMTGRGQTVAIIDAYDSPTIVGDAARYARRTGDPGFRPGQFIRYQAGPFTLAGVRKCGAPTSWYGEQTLDVEALHGLAPSADVRYVGARSCRQQDMLNAMAFVVNRHLASIVSDSYGWGESDYELQAAVNAVFQLGAAQGIGFFFSSGDHGYLAGNPTRIGVQFPASSPWITSVGGTSLAAGQSGRYEWESAWGTVLDILVATPKGAAWQYPPPGRFRPPPIFGGGGGGVSTTYPQPYYQRGVVPVGLATKLPSGRRSTRPMRVVPDVSADADPYTGIAVGQSTLVHGHYVFVMGSVGGTSQACPTIAGIQASAQQAAGGPLGFAAPAIYDRYGTSAFHDVIGYPLGRAFPSVVGQSRQFTFLLGLNIDGVGPIALPATRGYDDATGVGTPAAYIQSFAR